MSGKNLRFPKYNFGLLQTPDSSDLNSISDSTLMSNATEISKTLSTPLHEGFKNIDPFCNQSKSDEKLSSHPTTSKLSTTLFASEEISDTSVDKDLSHSVFQVPKIPAKHFSSSCTPKTPRNSMFSRSIFSVKNTPMIKGTPRVSCGETPRLYESSVIVAIAEGRGIARGEVGIASIDLKHPVLLLSQFPDSQTYVKTLTKLHILQPKEFIFPSTMCDSGNMSKVFKTVTENFPSSNVSTVQRRYFNEANGLEEIKRLAIKENNSIESDVKGKYYCLSAAAALIRYVEFIQNNLYVAQSLSVVYKGSEHTTLIDSKTASMLELLVNLENPKSSLSLFGVLNNTKTHGGAKLLRSNILQPPNDLPTIQARFDCADELSNSPDLFYGLQSALGRFEVDIDHLLACLVQVPKVDTEKTREGHINTCILLKHVTQLVPVLLDSLSNVQCDLLQAYQASLNDVRFGHIRDLLEKVIHKDAKYQKGHLNMRTQRCFAVKPGIHGVLDLARQTYTEYIDDINELIRQLGEKHDLSLKSSYNVSRGFHIQLPAKDAFNLPPDFVKITKSKKTWSFTTNDLIQLNDRLDQSIKDINCIADTIVTGTLHEIRGDIGCIYNLSEIVSTLDMLVSFAHIKTTTDYVRPEFTDTLAIKQGKHPILAKITSNVIANNVYASEGSNFNVITGPNMAGKSTYLKMISLLQIMAQIGCYVPAEFASLRVSDHIFSRVGSDDDIDTNTSSFTMEMKEVNYIMQNLSNNSLVIIDELGRGTSAEEGVGLCWAISEFILTQKAFTFFATHFLELCRLESVYPNVQNYHFEIQHVLNKHGGFRKVVYTYVLSRGFTDQSHYGLQLAELFNFPSSLLEDAKSIAERMKEMKKAAETMTSSKQLKENANYKFATKLLQVARSSRLDDDALMNYVMRLKEDYQHEISKFSNETPPESSSTSTKITSD